MESEDLGFVYTVRRNGAIEIRHHGRLAAAQFLAEAQTGADLQPRMARLTGNYRRGNERQAASHPRNRR